MKTAIIKNRCRPELAALLLAVLLNCTEGPTQNTNSGKICPAWPQPKADAANPAYRILSPNGGERFRVGEPCTVKISSQYEGEADIHIAFGSVANSFRLPLLADGNTDPQTDSVHVFIIPENFVQVAPNQADPSRLDTIRISTVSDSCFIRLIDYNYPTDYFDFSDCYFSIAD